jgi:antitoxin (DNA-binding transcriptional repressor) of toxin-antitoxin stability system
MNVSVHGAKAPLSKLLDLVEDGEDVVIVIHRALAKSPAQRFPSASAMAGLRHCRRESVGRRSHCVG